jgi:hypothetical protein
MMQNHPPHFLAHDSKYDNPDGKMHNIRQSEREPEKKSQRAEKRAPKF